MTKLQSPGKHFDSVSKTANKSGMDYMCAGH